MTTVARLIVAISPDGALARQLERFTPTRGARVLEKGGSLAEGASLRIEAARGGKVTVSAAPSHRRRGTRRLRAGTRQ